jgi:hypothetical protein
MSTKPNKNDLKLFTYDPPSNGEPPTKDLDILLDENFEIASQNSTTDAQLQDSKPIDHNYLDFINIRKINRHRTNESAQSKTVPPILGTSKTHFLQKTNASFLKTFGNLTEKYENSSKGSGHKIPRGLFIDGTGNTPNVIFKEGEFKMKIDYCDSKNMNFSPGADNGCICHLLWDRARVPKNQQEINTRCNVHSNNNNHYSLKYNQYSGGKDADSWVEKDYKD